MNPSVDMIQVWYQVSPSCKPSTQVSRVLTFKAPETIKLKNCFQSHTLLLLSTGLRSSLYMNDSMKDSARRLVDILVSCFTSTSRTSFWNRFFADSLDTCTLVSRVSDFSKELSTSRSASSKTSNFGDKASLMIECISW